LRTNRRLGQNFLYDPSIIRRIVESAQILPEDTVVEIGPGPGTLTRVLSEKAGHVTAIELDPALYARLRAEFAGYRNVELVQAVLNAGFAVSPIPGASAPIAALVASGLPTHSFLYLGYLPRKTAERRQMLEKVSELPYTLIFLETPHRLLAALRDLYQTLGDRPMAAARELTKLHEEIFRGQISQAIQHFSDYEPRGEFTLVIGGAAPPAHKWSEEQLLAALRQSLAHGDPPSEIASRLAAQSGWPRRQIYQWCIRLARRNDLSAGAEGK